MLRIASSNNLSVALSIFVVRELVAARTERSGFESSPIHSTRMPLTKPQRSSSNRRRSRRRRRWCCVLRASCHPAIPLTWLV
eukprot:05290_5